jgi:UrcA family protein
MFAKTSYAKTSLAALAAVAALGFAVSAPAAPAAHPAIDPDTVAVKVSFAGLNLASPAGAKVLLQRIHAAAKVVCGEEPETPTLGQDARYRACIDGVVARTVEAFGNPLVTALNGGRDRTPQIVAANR